ncbi:MAG: response regulator, partial [Cyanobacteria bacterium J06659_2]
MTSSLPTSELVSTLQPPPEVSTNSILLVDDDAVSRTFVKAVLTRHGYSVLEASQGIEGLQVYQACLPALVILDARMPGMDGFECCRAMRQLPGGRHIPILMVTGLGDEESVNQAFEAGATDFVSKPVKMPVLVGRVRYLLEAALAERSLRQSEERYRSLVTTLQEVIFQLDIDGRLTFVNPVWTDIMGYSLEDSIGQPLERFLHPGEQARHTTQLAEVWQHPETSYRYRSRGQRQDGQMRWVEIQLCAPHPTANQAPQVAGRLRDIHERTTQEQYRRLEYAFTRILANTHNPVKAVRRVMQALCGTLEFQLGEFWQIDETRNLLTRRDAWHVNRPYVNRFADLGEYITLEDGMGIPGSAGNATAPFWVENFPHACSTMRQPMAALAKFSAALCIPISHRENRLGMVMLVSQNAPSPDQDLLRLMTILGRQLNQYWLRRQAEQQLQAQNQQFKLELQRA